MLRGSIPLVLNAAAVEGLWGKASLLRRLARKASTVLTPHAGEMAQLVGKSKDEIVATPQSKTFRYRGDVEGLAMAGSGDVLAGLLAGLVASGADALSASLRAVLLHAEAGRRLSRRMGRVGYLARKLAVEIPALLDQLCRE